MLSKALFKTGSRITIVAPLSLIPKRFFSEQKNSDAEETDDEKDLFEGDHSKYSEKEKQLIKAYEDSPYLRERREKFLNSLMVTKKESDVSQKSAKELRDAILFEELLRKEVDIVLYDCKGTLFAIRYFGNLFLIIFALCFGYYIYQDEVRPQKWPYYTICGLFIFGRLARYRKFQKFFVEKVVYNTNDKTLTITKRKTFTGRRYDKVIDKRWLLYTEDPYLNKKNVNYINMRTLEQYCIGYKYGWVNQALFAHIIAQRIKSFK